MESPQPETVEPPLRRSLGGRLRAYFLAGIIITAPIAITLYLAWLFVALVDQAVGNLIPAAYNPNSYLPFTIPGLGLVLVVVALTLIGAVTAGYLGRLFLRLSEWALAKMPVVRSVYAAVKQIFETVLQNQSQAFRQVAMVEYPRKGLWALGFITGVTRGEVQNMTADTLVNVFLPTTPNPTSGFLLFVPKSEVYILDMSVEDGIKMVVSGGIVTPRDKRPAEIKSVPVIPPRVSP